GLDFPVPMGTRVDASARGTTIYAGWNSGGYGNLVVLQHPDGFTTWYAHLSRVTTAVGQRVRSGEWIGLVGSTGYSTGPHLHFEIRRYDTPINPVPLFLPTAAAQSLNGGQGARTTGHDQEHADDHDHVHRCENRRPPRTAHASPAARANWIATERLCVAG
ncbi:MAG TPA: M23 family metallopeptidase, partial [Solirubrobacterales bacterium]|nr:M23 family metallopeptidase [Solirubrobacterales bacterium]